MDDDFDYSDRTWDPERLDVEWATLNAIREALRIGVRGQAAPTYQDALNVGRAVDPELFDSPEAIIANAQEPTAVRERRQRAEATSQLKGERITPEQLIENDIAEYEALQKASKGDTDKLVAKLGQLYRTRLQLSERPFTENQLLNRDTFTATRLPTFERQESFVGYRLPLDRAFRIRLLHPDKPEHVTGADMVYELYDKGLNRVRLVLLQYKIWSGEQLVVDERASRQIDKLQACVCNADVCAAPKGGAHSRAPYRLPCCTAFLRPTDKLQSPDQRLVSRGLHVPLCAAVEAISSRRKGGEVIRRVDVNGQALSQRVFEELFNRGMLGSRPLTIPEVQEFYRGNSILHPTDHLLIQVQDAPADSI